jgi:hypothetical protein
MNIHYIGPDKVETGAYRKRTGERRPTAKGTKPARQRSGQTYAGGRELRKAQEILSRRQNARTLTVNGGRKGKSIDYETAFQMPGSMKRRAR